MTEPLQLSPEQLKLFNEHKCPYCKTGMLTFRSQFIKGCVECYRTYNWPLNEDQQPLIKYQR
jgi:hypothetical protein